MTTSIQTTSTDLQESGTAALSSLLCATNPLSIRPLSSSNEEEVLRFLAARPLHTVFMAGFIRDNGLVNPLNRGTFYGCRDARGTLLGVALIGHVTLVEARTDEALAELATFAQDCDKARIIIGEHEKVSEFWKHYSQIGHSPRLVCREHLLEQKLPIEDFQRIPELRLATLDDLSQVMSAHAQIAFDESGVNPIEVDPIGFRVRTARRIEQDRVWVWIRNGELLFKADAVSETPEVIYVEGVYVTHDERGKGYGTRCMMQMGLNLLRRSISVSLLVNESNNAALRLYRKAGYEFRSFYDTIFLASQNTN